MALFDFLKKKTATGQLQTPASEPPVPVRNVPEYRPAQENARPPIQPPVQQRTIPQPQMPKPAQQPQYAPPAPVTPASVPPRNAQPQRNPQDRNGRAHSAWPKYGTGTAELVATANIKVFVDASFIKSGGFAAFREIWSKNRINTYVTRYYFILTCEKQKLTQEEQALVSVPDCKEFYCLSPEDCFTQMARKGLNWNILWLTDSSETGIQAQKAARQTEKLTLRWYGMDENGRLKSLSEPNRTTPTPVPAPVSVPAEPAKRNTIFAHSAVPARIGRAIAPALTVPAEGEPVTAQASGRQVFLREPVMTDHSSITYRTDDPALFAKIYTAGALRIDLFENKARRMVQAQVNIPGVCWPVDLLHNRNGAFVGVLVPASAGVQLSRSVLSGASGINQYFPGWDKRDVCAVALTILRTYEAIRETGALPGCFNPSSVYIESSQKVYFVDMDAWQIEGYPVLSRNLTFTPPELLGSTEKLHMYTEDEDRYQAALLAFMLMLPGKYPYAKRDQKKEDDGLRNMSFPFSIGEDMRRSEDAERPSGAWKIVWDHLPYRMCVSFYHSFHHNGNHSRPGTRLPASVWLDQIGQYERHLQTAQGAQSRALFPATFRRDPKRTFIRCNICGEEHPDFYFLKRIKIQTDAVNIWDKGYRVCLPCAVDQSRDPRAKFTCQNCKTTYFYTNRTKIRHEIGRLDFDWTDQKWCYTCKKQKSTCGKCGREVPLYQFREFIDKNRNLRRSVCPDCFGALVQEAKRMEEARKNQIYRSIRCRDCGCVFHVTVGEAEFFAKKGYSLPSRCSRCRGR